MRYASLTHRNIWEKRSVTHRNIWEKPRVTHLNIWEKPRVTHLNIWEKPRVTHRNIWEMGETKGNPPKYLGETKRNPPKYLGLGGALHLINAPYWTVRTKTGDLIWRTGIQISNDLGDFIDYLMKPLPENRPQNTQEILNYINEVKHNSGLPKYNQEEEQSTVVSYAPEYAGFFRRFFASALDNIILIIVMGLLGTIIFNDYSIIEHIVLESLIITIGIFGTILIILQEFNYGFEYFSFEDIKFLTLILFTTILQWFYLTRLESSPIKATFGKKIMGIVVTDLNGNPISFGRANVRYFAKIFSLITLLIGFIMTAFTKKKQGLHDIIAGTLVVKKKP